MSDTKTEGNTTATDDDDLRGIFAMLFALGVHKAREGRSGLAAMRAGLEELFDEMVQESDGQYRMFERVAEHRADHATGPVSMLAEYAADELPMMKAVDGAYSAKGFPAGFQGVAKLVKSGALFPTPELPEGFDAWLCDMSYANCPRMMCCLRSYRLFDGLDDKNAWVGWRNESQYRAAEEVAQQECHKEGRFTWERALVVTRRKLREQGVEDVLTEEEAAAQYDRLARQGEF